MKLTIFFASIAMLLMTSLQVVHAEKTLSVSTSNVMPWGIQQPDGNHQGMLVELARAFSAELQQPISNRLRPYPRVLLDIDRGNSDFAVLFKSPQSDNIGHSLGEVVEAAIIVVGKASHPTISSLDELQGKYIAHVRGSKYGRVFDDHPSLNKVAVKDMNQGLRMLMRDHVDLVISADQSIFYSIDSLQIDPSELKRVYVLSIAKADLYLSKQSAHVGRIDEFRAAVKRLRDKNILDQIFYRHDYVSSDHLNRDSRLRHRDLAPTRLYLTQY